MSRRRIIPYNPELKNLARELRRNMTLSEVLLWNELKNKGMLGYDFDRQRPVGNYIVDFFCKDLCLAIEIDGDTHLYRDEYDEARQVELEKMGVKFLRFDDIEVKRNMNNVLRVISDWIKRSGKRTPGPSLEGNAKENDLYSPNKPTPNPSREGNRDANPRGYVASVISVGAIPLGGSYPIRLQSMTNTDTLDTKASVAQCIRIIEAGADFVRLTAQGVREAENLALIKSDLRKAGFDTPLIADIHFNPAAAETAARIVEKVRINPGNYTDKRASFKSIELTEKEYNEELERIHSRLLPLIKICREHGTVIRIGINHGSLSDRIMTRFGNTPMGMVQSAMEFIHIFRNENFNNLVLSMKSSDTDIMIKSTRMLVYAMLKEGFGYPIHLGVTEAGEGEDGRIRSAAGIGALLQDGIGDTIRVSLSEDPEKEIPVAGRLAEYFPKTKAENKPNLKIHYNAPVSKPDIFRGVNGPLVLADFRSIKKINTQHWPLAGFRTEGSQINKTDSSADLVLSDCLPEDFPETVNLAVPYETWIENKQLLNLFPIILPGQDDLKVVSDTLNVIAADPETDVLQMRDIPAENSLVIFRYDAEKQPYEPLVFMSALEDKKLNFNIILNPEFSAGDTEDLQIRAAGTLGTYLTDNRISGIMVSNTVPLDLKYFNDLSFSILQCTDKRITRTIYLSCPTCGRTKFNLQETVKKVKAATGHLKGLKIAVMGCIVNGPGEMAGADYGYVGAAPGKVHIYKGTEAIIKNVPESEAINELLRLISEDRN